jgi:hypothetical protein
MAARQDQTLQIFLIIFIFLFLVTAVFAYLGWRGYSDQKQTAATLDTQLKEKTNQMQTQSTDLEDLRERMGFGRNDNTADVKKAADADMKALGGVVADEASRNYRKVLEALATENAQTTAREATLKQNVSARDKQLLAVQNEAKAQMDKFDAARKTAEQELAKQTAGFSEFRETLQKEQEALKKNLEDQRTNYEGQIAQRDTTIKDLTDKNAKLEHAVANLIENRKDEPESFEVADGRISWVNQNDGTVWINLGTGDSLRRQVTFSVFDADLHDAAKASRKGSIEVTRLLGDHMAEARITSDDPNNPILTGDNIYSQIWHRGKKLHFALTGVIDIDGDGTSDLQLARDLIALNGGVVDAYLDEAGKVQGEITANTRYLISGEAPEKTGKVALEKGAQEMYKTSSSLGVETVTITEFLSQMGYKPQDRMVQLGPGAKARDFPARPENVNSTSDATRFRSRPAPAPAAAATEN